MESNTSLVWISPGSASARGHDKVGWFWLRHLPSSHCPFAEASGTQGPRSQEPIRATVPLPMGDTARNTLVWSVCHREHRVCENTAGAPPVQELGKVAAEQPEERREGKKPPAHQPASPLRQWEGQSLKVGPLPAASCWVLSGLCAPVPGLSLVGIAPHFQNAPSLDFLLSPVCLLLPHHALWIHLSSAKAPLKPLSLSSM